MYWVPNRNKRTRAGSCRIKGNNLSLVGPACKACRLVFPSTWKVCTIITLWTVPTALPQLIHSKPFPAYNQVNSTYTETDNYCLRAFSPRLPTGFEKADSLQLPEYLAGCADHEHACIQGVRAQDIRQMQPSSMFSSPVTFPRKAALLVAPWRDFSPDSLSSTSSTWSFERRCRAGGL